MSATRRGFIWIIALPSFLLLCSLGVWQLARHGEKQEQSTRLASQAEQTAITLPASQQWNALDIDAWEYRRVHLQGVLHPAREIYWFNHRKALGMGYDILTPMRLSDGGWVVVNRGFIATPSPPLSNASEQEISLTGFLRKPVSRRWFDPADDVEARLWVVRDLTAMAARMDVAPVAPWFIHVEMPLVLSGEHAPPVASPVAIAGRQVNHIAYAMTWFAMAAVLAMMVMVYYWRGNSQERR